MDTQKSDTFAGAMFQGVSIVSRYMAERWPLIESILPRSSTQHRDQSLQGIFLRCRAWMHTLEKLNQTRDIQAIATAFRALLEFVADLIVLRRDKTNKSGWKYYWWAQSERLRTAENIVQFYREHHQPVPDEHSPMQEAVENEKAAVDEMRKALWPDPKHPNKPAHPRRWTGDRDLLADLRVADEYERAGIQTDLGLSLEELFETEYRKSNWFIHSGAASFWNLPASALSLYCGVALKRCCDLAMLCTKMVLTDFGFTEHLLGLKDEWDKIRLSRELAYLTYTEGRKSTSESPEDLDPGFE